VKDTLGMLDQGPRMVPLSIVARHQRYLQGLSLRRLQQMCRGGTFETATKYGSGVRAHWFVSTAEILSWKVKRNASQIKSN